MAAGNGQGSRHGQNVRRILPWPWAQVETGEESLRAMGETETRASLCLTPSSTCPSPAVVSAVAASGPLYSLVRVRVISHVSHTLLTSQSNCLRHRPVFNPPMIVLPPSSY